MTGVETAIPVESVQAFSHWLAANGKTERQVWIGIFKKASGRQTVGFEAILETALCHGWIDVQTKGIDEQRYAIRLVPRKPGGNWSATNRAIVARLLAGGRMLESGLAVLPDDLRHSRGQ